MFNKQQFDRLMYASFCDECHNQDISTPDGTVLFLSSSNKVVCEKHQAEELEKGFTMLGFKIK